VDEELALDRETGRTRQRVYAEVGYLSPEAVAIASLVEQFLAAMAVPEGEARARLVRRVQTRVYARLDRETELPLGELAVHETLASLDEWLRVALDAKPGVAQDLMPARAALLAGAIPDWYEAVLRAPQPGHGERLRQWSPRALPSEHPLAMPVATLRLRRFRPFYWLLRALGWKT
jgi:hypothetical protein